MSSKIRAFELQSKNKTDLLKQLTELKTELASLRVQKIAGGSAAKVTKMCVARWGIGNENDADMSRSQQHCPQVDRPCLDRHQPEATPKPPRVLQELQVFVYGFLHIFSR